MRQLIVTITTPEGEIIDRETIEVEDSVGCLDILARKIGEAKTQGTTTLIIGEL